MRMKFQKTAARRQQDLMAKQDVTRPQEKN
jgi:hypothetical protein